MLPQRTLSTLLRAVPQSTQHNDSSRHVFPTDEAVPPDQAAYETANVACCELHPGAKTIVWVTVAQLRIV
jgi:hypothetical protein